MSLPDIPQTTSTPCISFVPETNRMVMVGESYPENSFSFYAPIFAWIREHLATGEPLTLDINIDYMNSSSTKCMLDLLDLLEDHFKKGMKVEIVWRFDQENSRSLDLAEEFCEEVTLPFKIVALND
jgi:hypothetical protein